MSTYLARIVPVDQAHTAIPAPISPRDNSFASAAAELEVAAGVDFPRCELVLDRLGSFRRAGVLWLGASEVPPDLALFQHALVGALLDADIGHDRKPWKPHLTLYRKLRTPPPTMPTVAIRWRLERFSLVESVSVNRGVVYHDIATWNAGR